MMQATHEVFNQALPRSGNNLLDDNAALRDAIAFNAPQLATAELARLGAVLATPEMQTHARLANVYPPQLHTHDRFGRREDRVEFHPSYHALMNLAVGSGLHGTPWGGAADDHVRRAAGFMLFTELEPSVLCPISMTFAVTPALRANPALAAQWGPLLVSRSYDPRFVEGTAKPGVTMGMGMTEKQGGSDVRANTTRATPAGSDAWGRRFEIVGHKWFLSAPMSDAFLVLAQSAGGMSCFFMPRLLPDGSVNAIRIQRLKDKLGNRSNASAEIEYHRALAWQLGGEGDGVRTILEMVHHTRLDTAMAPAGLMRAALREAHHWVSRRTAFQKRLIDQPLMRAILADLVLDWQGSLTLGLAVARSFDGTGEGDRAFARIGVALAKYLANKLCPPVVAEAMEVLGGMGYVEDTPLPLLYREAPLNGIWEGSGNVICLDALRTLAREPLAREALAARLEAERGLDRHYDSALADWRERWGRGVAEAEARWFVEQGALLLTAAVLLEAGDETLAAAFIRTRLGGERGRTGGTIPAGLAEAILARGFPFHD